MSRAHRTLAILTHWTDGFRARRYLIQLLIPRWEAMGFTVMVVTDRDPFVPADAAVLHVDLSVVPDSCRRLAERYPVVLNGGVLDIRKRGFSQQQLDQRTPYKGQVIVKSNWNFGGSRELRRGVMESPIGRMLLRQLGEHRVWRGLESIERRKPWRWRRMLPISGYCVYPDRDQVPTGVWSNPNLIVERFLAERAGSDYSCRHWIFLGDREVTRRVTSDQAVVKASARLEATSDTIPPELRAIRTRLGFDYGKFDYGIVDGQVVLYDVNRTPGAAADGRTHAQTIEVLSPGLEGILASNQ